MADGHALVLGGGVTGIHPRACGWGGPGVGPGRTGPGRGQASQ